jgi:hypothetical protein
MSELQIITLPSHFLLVLGPKGYDGRGPQELGVKANARRHIADKYGIPAAAAGVVSSESTSRQREPDTVM